ncbi:MAG: hypothetical protein JSS91_11930 [Bacteroidetes bacterium]|nr:hypothetical protein [Bacteroidota bacterium]
MEDTVLILQIVINVIIIILFITIIVLMLKISRIFKHISTKMDSIALDSKEIKPKIISAFDKIGMLAENVNKATEKVNENIDVLGTVVERVKDTAESVIEFEQKIQNAIEPPVMDTVNTITAVSVGIKTFFDSWKRSKKRNGLMED